jgi:hypothetical protein
MMRSPSVLPGETVVPFLKNLRLPLIALRWRDIWS